VKFAIVVVLEGQDMTKTSQEREELIATIKNDATYCIDMPITWFLGNVNYQNIAQAVYQNPETGQMVVQEYTLIRRGCDQGGNSWERKTAHGGHPVGDLPKTCPISVTGRFLIEAHRFGSLKGSLYTGSKVSSL